MAVEEYSCQSGRTHVAEIVVLSVHAICVVPVLVEMLQCVGIDGDNLTQKFAYVPLVYLLRYIEFGLGGVALVLSEWTVYGAASEALFVVAPLYIVVYPLCTERQGKC